MQRDILNRKIKKYYTNHEKHFFGKFYEYNNKYYKIVRLRYIDNFKTPFYILTILGNKLNTKDIIVSKIDFNKMKFFDKKPKSRMNNYKYRFCYFSTKEMKNKMNIIEKLYELGYTNYSRTTAISFYQYPYCIINKRGEFMTTGDNSEILESLGYRNLFDFYEI
jgi:hypothetical protein